MLAELRVKSRVRYEPQHGSPTLMIKLKRNVLYTACTQSKLIENETHKIKLPLNV